MNDNDDQMIPERKCIMKFVQLRKNPEQKQEIDSIRNKAQARHTKGNFKNISGDNSKTQQEKKNMF